MKHPSQQVPVLQSLFLRKPPAMERDTKEVGMVNQPASQSDPSETPVVAYIDPVKEAKMMRKFDVRALILISFS